MPRNSTIANSSHQPSHVNFACIRHDRCFYNSLRHVTLFAALQHHSMGKTNYRQIKLKAQQR